MSRIRIAFAALLATSALLAPTLAHGSTQKNVLLGTVGPGFTITLKTSSGATVKELSGGSYTIKVSDKSSIHNFRLVGPGINKEITSVGFVGTKSVTLTLKGGKYAFDCDPHKSLMKGSFIVS